MTKNSSNDAFNRSNEKKVVQMSKTINCFQIYQNYKFSNEHKISSNEPKNSLNEQKNCLIEQK